MHFRSLFILTALIVFISSCGTDKSYRLENNVLYVKDEMGSYRLSALSEAIINVRYEDSIQYANREYAPVLNELVPLNVSELEETIIVKTKEVKIEISLHPINFKFYDLTSGRLKLAEETGFFYRSDTTGFRFQLQNKEALYGTGSRAVPLNRRGLRYLNYNQPQYGYGYGGTEINYSIPHIYSSEQYMLLIDNPAKAWWDLGARESDVLEFSSLGGNQSYYFINGNNFNELINTYTELTGKQPLPPIWAMGNLHSRFGYHTQNEFEDNINRALSKDYPIDAGILDIYWFGPELENGQMGRLDWDLENWPDPKGMIDAMHAQDVKMITVSEPFFTLKSGRFEELAKKGYLATRDNGEAATIPDFYFGEGGLLDIFNPEAKAWIWDQYKYMKTFGVDGWWVDLGEPEKHPSYMRHVNGTADEIHGVYGHEWAAMLHEGYQKDFPNERLLHLGRSGFAGTQRYGLIPWSGDISRSWSGLRAQPTIMLGMGMSGLGYMHSDAGGFSMTEKGDNELYTRWLQFSAFTPIFRPHADEMVPSEPFLWPEEVQNNVKPFVQLRYDLLPYNYTMAWKNKMTGIPMARAMFTAYPELPDTLESQYMWGDDLLIAPVLKQGQKTKQVYLPEGKWYDFWDFQSIDGGKWVDRTLTIQNIPVYIKGGAIIPRTSGLDRSIKYANYATEIHYFYDASTSQAFVYYDDGITNGYLSGEHELLDVQVKPDVDGLTISLKRKGNGYPEAPTERQLKVMFYGLPKSLKSLENIDIQSLQQCQAISFGLKDEISLRLDY